MAECTDPVIACHRRVSLRQNGARPARQSRLLMANSSRRGILSTRAGARPVVAGGLRAPSVESSSRRSGPKHLSAFGQRLLDLPSPPRDHAVRGADFRCGDLSGTDFPVAAWRRALSKATIRRPARLRYGEPQGSLPLRTALQGYRALSGFSLVLRTRPSSSYGRVHPGIRRT